jgi:hypothetical protein
MSRNSCPEVTFFFKALLISYNASGLPKLPCLEMVYGLFEELLYACGGLFSDSYEIVLLYVPECFHSGLAAGKKCF